MNISQESFLTPDEILADVIEETEDFEYRISTKGWYLSQMQQCLEELSFDSFLLTIKDDFEFPSENYSLALPANAFNVRDIFVYNGAIGDPTDSQRVYWKRAASRKNTNEFIAPNKSTHTEDPFFSPLSQTTEAEQLWAAIDNGVITFSDQCATYSYVHIRYNGTLTPIGETPFVPQFFRQAVKLFVSLQFYRKMRKRHPRVYRTLFNDVHQELYAPLIGVWDTAVKRAHSLDTKSIDDMREYLSKMNY